LALFNQARKLTGDGMSGSRVRIVAGVVIESDRDARIQMHSRSRLMCLDARSRRSRLD